MEEIISTGVRRKRSAARNIQADENECDNQIGVGNRLHEIRIQMGLSIRALAEMSGLNVNTLSLIENGRTSPSVGTLQQLAQSLQMPITAFFETVHGEKKVVFQKNSSHPRTGFAHGILEDMGAGMPRSGAEPLLMALFPYAASGVSPIVHTGREFVYCLEGHIAYTVENETFVLEPGDSLFFEAYLPHSWKNPDDTPSRALLVLCPLDDRDRPTERHFVSN
jgi:transcriptional regulator with XRE-family HTH domain